MGFSFTTGTIAIAPGDPFHLDWFTTGVELSGTGGEWNLDAPLEFVGDILTIDGSQVLNDASLTVHADDPARFNNGTEFQFAGGVWEFADYLAITNPANGGLGSALINASGNSARFAINTNESMTTSASSVTIGPGGTEDQSGDAANYLTCKNHLGFIALNVDIDGNLIVGGNIESPGSITADTEFIVDDAVLNGSGLSISTGDVALSNGNITISAGDIVLNNGSIDVPIGPVVVGGGFADPQVIIISTIPGGLAANNIGADEDVHAGISMYAKRSFVAGHGAQHFGKSGAIITSTEGSGTAPYAGYARGSIYSDQQGQRYTVLQSSAPYRGSLGNWHNFDATVATSGTLATSTTLSLEGSSHEGQATIPSGTSTVTVSTALVADGDTPWLNYPDSQNGGGALYSELITPSTSFVIRSSANVTTNTLVNWKLIK